MKSSYDRLVAEPGSQTQIQHLKKPLMKRWPLAASHPMVQIVYRWQK